jgi:hypothetical protein
MKDTTTKIEKKIYIHFYTLHFFTNYIIVRGTWYCSTGHAILTNIFCLRASFF